MKCAEPAGGCDFCYYYYCGWSAGSASGLVGGVIHSPAGLGIPLSLPDSVWSGLFPSDGNGDGTSALSHQASLYSVNNFPH